ncbi:MAG: hypothetical protein P0S96_02960 [Simkaniaceae bacterium]|nr:hypothetical protein [Candidatus Sacchlamyda saccharinae]
MAAALCVTTVAISDGLSKITPSLRRAAMLLVAAGVVFVAFTYIGSASAQAIGPLTQCQQYLQDLPGPKDLIGLVNKTGYLKCENFLPWKEEFSGIGTANEIRPEDMGKSVMWAVSPKNGFVVAVRHICNDARVGAIAFVQSVLDKTNVVAEGHFQSDRFQCRFLPQALGYLKGVLEKAFVLIKDTYYVSYDSWTSQEFVGGVGNFSLS